LIRVLIGHDSRERAATNVLIDNLVQHHSVSLAITPLVAPQLEAKCLYWRERNPKRSTAFSFTRNHVSYMMGYQGWAIFMDCDMLCRGDIAELWAQRDDSFALLCVQQDHQPSESKKFLGESRAPTSKRTGAA